MCRRHSAAQCLHAFMARCFVKRADWFDVTAHVNVVSYVSQTYQLTSTRVFAVFSKSVAEEFVRPKTIQKSEIGHDFDPLQLPLLFRTNLPRRNINVNFVSPSWSIKWPFPKKKNSSSELFIQLKKWFTLNRQSTIKGNRTRYHL
jgi:hypothetical protein